LYVGLFKGDEEVHFKETCL